MLYQDSVISRWFCSKNILNKILSEYNQNPTIFKCSHRVDTKRLFELLFYLKAFVMVVEDIFLAKIFEVA